MEEPDRISDPDNWIGGFYELALEMGDRDDSRLEAAILALREGLGIGRFYPGASVSEQEPVIPTLETLGRVGQLRGTVLLPTGDRVVCALMTVREEAEPPHYAPDWLTVGIPFGALERIDKRVVDRIDDEAGFLAWSRPVDDWLAQAAERVFKAAPFRLGLIGVEVSGEVSSDRLGTGVPDSRSFGYLVPRSDGALQYHPATF